MKKNPEFPKLKKRSTARRGGRRQTRQGGFSLLEILVAFAILALTLGVLLRIFGGGVRSVALADEHAQAVLFAESLLARVGSETPVVAGESRGELDERYRWVLRITPFVVQEMPETMPAKPFWVEAQVQWGEDDEYHEFTLGTLRLTTETGMGGLAR